MTRRAVPANESSESSCSSDSSESEFEGLRVKEVRIPELAPIRVPLEDRPLASSEARDEFELMPDSVTNDMPAGFLGNNVDDDAMAKFNTEIAELGEIEAEAVSEALAEEMSDPAAPDVEDLEQLRKDELESIVRSGVERRAKRARETEPTSDVSEDDWRSKAI